MWFCKNTKEYIVAKLFSSVLTRKDLVVAYVLHVNPMSWSYVLKKSVDLITLSLRLSGPDKIYRE
jgi:hypothetical protein